MEIKASYRYKDESGDILYTKHRLEGPEGKSFSYERLEDGKVIHNLDGCRRVLYQLPTVLWALSRNMPIHLVEGEKDVHTLMRLEPSLIATTTISSLQWDDSYTDLLRNADVVVFFDYDKAGFKRRDELIQELKGRVRSLKVVDLPGIEYRENKGLDVTDWLNMGNSTNDLIELIENSEICELPQPKGIFNVINSEDLLSLDIPKREMIINPLLPTQGLAMLFAQPGVGKTHVAFGIAYAVASGGKFLKWSSDKPRKVLYLDGEMAAEAVRERYRMVHDMSETKAKPGHLRFLTQDLQDCPMPDLSTPEGRQSLEPYLVDRELIVLDNLSCLFRSGDESNSTDWHEAQTWLLDLKRRSISVLVVHHAGKSGAQRGTSKREDIMDTIIELSRPDNYTPEEGARFIVSFPKARGFRGYDAKPFEAQLFSEKQEHCWEINTDVKPPRDDTKQDYIKKLKEMKASGHTLRSLAELEGVSPVTIHKLLNQ